MSHSWPLHCLSQLWCLFGPDGSLIELSPLWDKSELGTPTADQLKTILGPALLAKSNHLGAAWPTPNGEKRWLEWSLFHDPEGRHLVMAHDITDVVQKDSELEQQRMMVLSVSKMATLGEMAANVAHEINNPLAIITGRISILSKHADKGPVPGELVKSELQKLEKTAMRISKTIKGLRSYARDSDRDPRIQASLAGIIEDTMELCTEKLRSQSVEMRLGAVPEVYLECRPVQISQVLLNLIGNAIDAIAELPEKWISIDVTTANQKVLIRVCDAGKGIPPKIVKKMMEPFFTTKAQGRGTGLGLSISRNILEAHGGGLNYDPTWPNTSFILEIPQAVLKQGAA